MLSCTNTGMWWSWLIHHTNWYDMGWFITFCLRTSDSEELMLASIAKTKNNSFSDRRINTMKNIKGKVGVIGMLSNQASAWKEKEN